MMSERYRWPGRHVWGAVWLLGLGSCTQEAPWRAEGTEGQACFPDDSCDPGLRCLGGTCQLEVPVGDGGVLDRGVAADLRRRDGVHPGQEGGTPVPDRGVDLGPCAKPVVSPTLTGLPVTTAVEVLAVSGAAPGAKEVIVTGGVVTKIAPVQGTGFCTPVGLHLGATNHLEAVARDGKGCTSLPTKFEVIQASPSPINVLYNIPAQGSSNNIVGGTFGNVTDGKTSPTLKLSFYDPDPQGSVCDDFVHLRWDLGSEKTIDQVVVKYPVSASFKNYATCWDLWVSTLPDPAPPDPDPDSWEWMLDWDLAEAHSNSPSGDLFIDIPGTKGRHLALLLYEDGVTGSTELFDLAEVEAWSTPPVPPPETCP